MHQQPANQGGRLYVWRHYFGPVSTSPPSLRQSRTATDACMMQQELNILLRKEVFDHLIVTDYAMDGIAQAFHKSKHIYFEQPSWHIEKKAQTNYLL